MVAARKNISPGGRSERKKRAAKSSPGFLQKAHFWLRVSGVALNERQIKIINRLLDGFEGKITSSKWAAIAKSSSDTALRDINELVELGILQRSGAGDEVRAMNW